MLDKDELLKIKRYKTWIDCYAQRIKEVERLKRLASIISSSSEILNSLDAWKAQLIEKQSIWEQCRLSVIQSVEAISDERYREIIRLRYIEGKAWEQIPPIVNFSYSHVLYLHKQFWEKEGDENES